MKAINKAAIFCGVLVALVGVGCAGQMVADLTPMVEPEAGTVDRTTGSELLGLIADVVMKDEMEELGLAGATVGIRLGEDERFVGGYGLADIENGVEADVETIYQIGSLTKQFTAAGVMRLVESGVISLDEPVATYYPDIAPEWQTITVAQLLNHSSGLPQYFDLPEYQDDLSAAEDGATQAILETAASYPLDFEPGAQLSYTSTGYILLGLMIEQVTGLKYAEFIRQEVIEPAGLSATTYCDTYPEDMARGYLVAVGDFVMEAEPMDHRYAYAAGALCSTAEDLLDWQIALSQGVVVSEESYAAMATPSAFLPNIRAFGSGYGLAAGPLLEEYAVYHSGFMPGYSNNLVYYPEHDLAVVVMSNTEGINTDELVNKLAFLVLRQLEDGS